MAVAFLVRISSSQFRADPTTLGEEDAPPVRRTWASLPFADREFTLPSRCVPFPVGSISNPLTGPAWAARPPNVVIIMGDDVGYGDVGAYSSEFLPPPNIDHLASQGIRFTDGHSTASTCSPSRVSLLTGAHDFRYGVSILSPVSPLCIPTDIETMPKMFQKAGYATAAVGKWHLGLGAIGKENHWNGEVKPGPIEIGFDSSFILPITNDRVPCVYLDGHKVPNLDPKDPLFVSSKKPIKASAKNAKSTVYPSGAKNPETMTHPAGKGKGNHSNTVINGIMNE